MVKKLRGLKILIHIWTLVQNPYCLLKKLLQLNLNACKEIVKNLWLFMVVLYCFIVHIYVCELIFFYKLRFGSFSNTSIDFKYGNLLGELKCL